MEKEVYVKRAWKYLWILMACAFIGILSPVKASAMGQAEVQARLQAQMNQYVGKYWTGSYNTERECKGFASMMMNNIFGIRYIGAYGSEIYYLPRYSGVNEVGRLNFGQMSRENAKNLLSKGYPGDYIQVRRRNKSYGHTMILVSRDNNGITVFDCNVVAKNKVGKYYINWTDFYNQNSAMSLYHAKNYEVGHNPEGYVDSVVAGVNSITIKGWAFDRDSLGTSLDIHVYIGGELHGIKANKSRPDVDRVHGVGGNHGFEATIATNRTGVQTIYIYALNVNGGTDHTLLGTKTVTILADKQAPKISNVKVSNVSSSGYTVSCTVTDNGIVDRVQFPTWTIYKGQDDIQKDWTVSSKAAGNKSGNTYTYRVNTSDHGNQGGAYITHIYASDKSGNAAFVPLKDVVVPPRLTYRAHSKDKGWLSYVGEGATGGTTGKVLQMEALKIKFQTYLPGSGITYRVHMKDRGWGPWVKDDAVAGTVGQSRRIEAIQIKLTGEISKSYHVQYRTHLRDKGWTGWSRNGVTSGTVGQSRAVEAVQIKLVKK